MIFEEFPHWNDGLFLQPHHFQYLDRVNAASRRANRALAFAFPYGFIDLEYDSELLSKGIVKIPRFQAIMPDGLELSQPGNCVLPILDLKDALKENPQELTISLAVPRWSEFESNIAEEDKPYEKKIYVPKSRQVRDENSGDNEITLITRRVNARLVTNLDNTGDMELLPALKISVISRDDSGSKTAVNPRYIPPYIILSKNSSLFELAYKLLADMRQCRDKLLNTLNASAFRNEQYPADKIYTVLLCQTLSRSITRITGIMDIPAVPYTLFMESLSLLSELMCLTPNHSITELPQYSHNDCAPAFSELARLIRSLILAEGGAAYKRYPFKAGGDTLLYAKTEVGELAKSEEVYLSALTDANEFSVINAFEQGDTFKVTSEASKKLRVRGLKLFSVRYPPRIFPVINGALWFKIQIEDSKIWDEIRKDSCFVIDYADTLFPSLDVSLFLLLKKEASQ